MKKRYKINEIPLRSLFAFQAIKGFLSLYNLATSLDDEMAVGALTAMKEGSNTALTMNKYTYLSKKIKGYVEYKEIGVFTPRETDTVYGLWKFLDIIESGYIISYDGAIDKIIIGNNITNLFLPEWMIERSNETSQKTTIQELVNFSLASGLKVEFIWLGR